MNLTEIKKWINSLPPSEKKKAIASLKKFCDTVSTEKPVKKTADKQVKKADTKKADTLEKKTVAQLHSMLEERFKPDRIEFKGTIADLKVCCDVFDIGVKKMTKKPEITTKLNSSVPKDPITVIKRKKVTKANLAIIIKCLS